MRRIHRRAFLAAGAAAAGGLVVGHSAFAYLPDNPPGERPETAPDVEVLHSRGRVPLSFIIDDSTCLVNMAHFAMPQFAEAWPDREIYRRPWKTWPREIPDDFVREFGEWCADRGVKGKYSIVPFPSCVGWLDRELPGWSRAELRSSLALVRDLLLPNWDIHPEMITHTRVIDLATGRPLEPADSSTMENSWPQERKSVDEIASYLAYALRILERCDLPCEGITTPGGFGNLVKSELSLAVGEAVRDVYRVELPHYFKYVADGAEDTRPLLEHVSGLGTSDLRVVVNVPAGTGDWFGGWDGDRPCEAHLYADAEARTGRMVELIERGEPAVMLCHWPGLYCHGAKTGLREFQRVVDSLASRYRDRTLWMKPSELARYEAARQLTAVRRRPDGRGWSFDAPFTCPDFTVRVPARGIPPMLEAGGARTSTRRVEHRHDLVAGTWWSEGDGSDGHLLVCFDLARGETTLGI